MRTRIIWWTTGVCLIALGVNLWAQFPGWSRENARQRAAAERLMVALRMEKSMSDTVALTLVQVMNLFPETRDYEDILVDYAEEQLSWEALEPVIAGWYAELFDEQELAELAGFLDSPTGRKWVQNAPLLAARMEQLVRERFMADLAMLELRMKNRELDLVMERSVFHDSATPGAGD